MNFRSLTIATGLVAASALLMGCPDDKPADGAGKLGGSSAAPKPGAPAASASASASAAGAAAAPYAAPPAAEGKGILKGVVKFSGTAPEMKVPKARESAEVCKDSKITHNAVLVKDGMLQDVFVGIDNGQIKDAAVPSTPVAFHQKECVYSPRLLGLVAGQEVEFHNDDATAHNVHSKQPGVDDWNQMQGSKAPPLKAPAKNFEELGFKRMQCDVHPWMRAFAVISDNPYFGVTGADGSFKIEKVPAGKFKVVAWHSMFGKLEKADVEVKDGEVTVDFEFTGKEAAPAENPDELKDLF